TCPAGWSEGLLHERVCGRTRGCWAAAEVTVPKPERGPQWTREPHRDGAQRWLHDFKGDTSGGQRQPSRIGWMWPDSHVSPPSSAAPRCFCAGYDVGRTGALWVCPQRWSTILGLLGKTTWTPDPPSEITMNDAHVDAIWERTLATLRHDNTVSQRVIALLMLSRLMAVVADTALVAAPSTSAKELFEHRIAASLTSALSEA